MNGPQKDPPDEREGVDVHEVRPCAKQLHDFGLLLKAVAQVDGVPSAVLLANAATAHRFTGVYRFDDDLLMNLCTWDKQDGLMTSGMAAPLHETYCMHILQSGQALTVLDSLDDSRLAGHPRRQEVRSYCGAPLLDRHGQIAGTFCHFDAQPNQLGPADFELVHIAAVLLQDRVLADA